MSENLWRLVFDNERFNDVDMHHFSWGSAYKAEASDLIAVVRRGVESGTIKGEVVEWCETHGSQVPYTGDGVCWRVLDHAEKLECSIVSRALLGSDVGESR